MASLSTGYTEAMTSAPDGKLCRIHEYDGAYRCYTHNKMWGATTNPNHPCDGWNDVAPAQPAPSADSWAVLALSPQQNRMVQIAAGVASAPADPDVEAMIARLNAYWHGSSNPAQQNADCRDAAAMLARLRDENICDCCLGTSKPISGKPCICGGTGKMSNAVYYLHAENARLTQELCAKKPRLSREQLSTLVQLQTVEATKDWWRESYWALGDRFDTQDAELETVSAERDALRAKLYATE